AVLAVELLQVAVLGAVALALGWHVHGSVASAVVAMLLATVGFAGLGLLMAGTMRGEMVLAAANGLYLVLLLLGGMVVPLQRLPGAMQAVARALPAGALSDALHRALGGGHVSGWGYWCVLAGWAGAPPLAAALTFKWE